MKTKALQLIAVAGLGLAILVSAQATPAGNAGAPAPQKPSSTLPANQPPLQLSTPGELPPPQPIRFPPADPKNFTAASPSAETVNAFLKQLWGYDVNRVWQVEAIQKTEAPGTSRVIVFVGDQGSRRGPAETLFYVTPDGQHAVAGNQIIDFGADPFAAKRAILQQRANGPARGPASKALLLVEFMDLQCPQCKAAQPTMDRLAQDFPGARIVYQAFPLPQLHPSAEKAADYGHCVAQLKGNEAYFKFAQAVFDNQAALTPTGTDQALKDAAVKAGADAVAVKDCADTTSTKDAIAASVQLGKDLGVNQTPTLFVNGRSLPLSGIPYDTLKQLLTFEETQASAQPSQGKAAPLQSKPATSKP
ncbi:MAG: thioredoxin domain-containing protein [Acidobacteriaceae bacterium]